jgi:4-amino-4-deoxy-L-arabinose transferase-like glycosyltransferase
VPLTEVFATFWTALACCGLVLAFRRIAQPNFLLKGSHLPLRSVEYAALAAGLIVGAGTLFRPEAPLLLIAAIIIFGEVFLLRKNYRRWIWVCLALAFGCLTILSPWAVRNMVTLGEPQFLAPKNSNLPGELVPYGFMAWEKTWLYRVRECYLVPWRLNEEAIFVEDMPARAFDTPEEKQRVAAILEPYNNDLMLTPEEDALFSQLAHERNARHPLRTYLWVPAAREATIWFTPRIELLPISGHVFPLRQMREDDPVDQEVTSLFYLLNIFYVGLGLWGAARLWRSNPAARVAVAFLVLFVVLRTTFLTTLETPEPRYVLVCFPALIALGAQAFAGRSATQ